MFGHSSLKIFPCPIEKISIKRYNNLMKEKKQIYYRKFDYDVVINKGQNYELPEDYKWINRDLSYQIKAKIAYFFAKIFGRIYLRLILHTKIENADILSKYKKTGYFVYGNHTQMIGDVFAPAIACKKKHIYTIASPANLGIKVIRKTSSIPWNTSYPRKHI